MLLTEDEHAWYYLSSQSATPRNADVKQKWRKTSCSFIGWNSLGSRLEPQLFLFPSVINKNFRFLLMKFLRHIQQKHLTRNARENNQLNLITASSFPLVDAFFPETYSLVARNTFATWNFLIAKFLPTIRGFCFSSHLTSQALKHYATYNCLAGKNFSVPSEIYCRSWRT